MTNNSPVYWTGNGLSLHTHAWSVKSFGGRRWAGPSKRGEDRLIPFRRGRMRTRKLPESQVLNLNMWVIPVNTDGTKDPNLTRVQKAHENWRTIVESLNVDGPFDLTKRWYEGSTIKSATAQAEWIEGDGPSADDGSGFDFRATLLLADPYFYDPVPEAAIGGTILGDVPTDHVVIKFNSGTNPRLTLPNGNWIQYNGTVSSPVTIDVLDGLAMQGSSYVNGLIVRNPKFPDWPTLVPGTTPVLSGGGTGTIQYDAAYR